MKMLYILIIAGICVFIGASLLYATNDSFHETMQVVNPFTEEGVMSRAGELIGDKEKPKEAQYIDDTPTTHKECTDGRCTMTLFGGARVKEDGVWIQPENATSLMGSEYKIGYLEQDEDFNVEVVDYNWTSITVDLTPDLKHVNKDIPVKEIQYNETKASELSLSNWKDEYDVKTSEDIRFTETTKIIQNCSIDAKTQEEICKNETIPVAETIRRTYEFGMDKAVEFGFNSTTLILDDDGAYILEDTYINEDSPATNDGSNNNLYAMLRATGGYQQNFMTKWDISSLPNGVSITNANISIL